MKTNLYSASIPVFQHYLDRLDGLVNAAESHACRQGWTCSVVLSAHLAADMLPFSKQVEIAANFALRTCFPLAGEQVPSYGDFPATFDGLRERVGRAKMLIATLDPAAFHDAGERIIEDRAGNAMLRLNGLDFLTLYALPNFFFHLTTAYAILRALGLPLGKEQFDGFHSYATV